MDGRKWLTTFVEDDVDPELVERSLDPIPESYLVCRGRLAGLDLEEEVEIATLDVIVHARTEHADDSPCAEDGACGMPDRSDLVGLEAHWEILRRLQVCVKFL
jgi:hypothetical protein